MLTIRKSEERGGADHGWLKARHTFSFASYMDPAHVRFRTLRVINEDRVQPSTGFPTHGHEDMEILTYVLDGELEHKDSMGSVGQLRYGDVQVMSAGTGVTHSEYNASTTDPLHLLQIWIFPDRKGHEPAYREAHYDRERKLNRLQTIASPDGIDDSLRIHQDTRVFASIVEPNAEPLRYELADGRGAWIQVCRGELVVGGDQRLSAGDGASLDGAANLGFAAGSEEAEFLLFDLN
jgi:redox-sensitive bicupin YhaK (pirin superfamily)